MENAYNDYGILKYEIEPTTESLPKIKNIIEQLRTQILYYIDQLKNFGIANEYTTNYSLRKLLEDDGLNETLLKFEEYMQLDLPENNYEDFIESNNQLFK